MCTRWRWCEREQEWRLLFGDSPAQQASGERHQGSYGAVGLGWIVADAIMYHHYPLITLANYFDTLSILLGAHCHKMYTLSRLNKWINALVYKVRSNDQTRRQCEWWISRQLALCILRTYIYVGDWLQHESMYYINHIMKHSDRIITIL